MYSILATAKIAETTRHIILGLGSRQLLREKEHQKRYEELLSKLADDSNDISYRDLVESSDEYQQAHWDLVKSGVVGESVRYDARDIGYKTRLYLEAVAGHNDDMKKNIRRATVLVIGCGGIGNQVAYALSSFGVASLVLIDGDDVEESNLNRQFLFRRDDIGLNKALAMKRALMDLNPKLDVVAVPRYVCRDELRTSIYGVSGELVAIVSADEGEFEAETYPTLVNHGVPFLNVGYLNDISVIGPFWTRIGDPCPLCHAGGAEGLVADKNGSLPRFTKSYQAPSCMVNNSLSGGMAV